MYIEMVYLGILKKKLFFSLLEYPALLSHPAIQIQRVPQRSPPQWSLSLTTSWPSPSEGIAEHSPELWFPTFFIQGTNFVDGSFCGQGGGWIWDDSSALHLWCTLFLLLLHQIHLRSSGIVFWRLGTPVLEQLTLTSFLTLTSSYVFKFFVFIFSPLLHY